MNFIWPFGEIVAELFVFPTDLIFFVWISVVSNLGLWQDLNQKTAIKFKSKGIFDWLGLGIMHRLS